MIGYQKNLGDEIMWHGNFALSAWPMLAGGILFWGGLISLVIWGFHRSTRQSEGSAIYRSAPLEILKQRYAAGEISRAEFEAMKQDLLG
jgi:putative membrane protein